MAGDLPCNRQVSPGDATPAIVNAIALPLEFLSGIFIAFGNSTPSWILWFAKVFPVRHFALAPIAPWALRAVDAVALAGVCVGGPI